ncbi:MAG: O-antigen ligase family protein [Mycobacterium kyogaense]
MIREDGRLRRILRLACFACAVFILASASARVAIGTAALLLILGVLVPVSLRWMAQVSALLATISAYLLPVAVSSIQFLIAPLISLAPGRISESQSITSLEGRDYIWERSISFWREWVSDFPHILFGYGVNGQYHSGASFSFSERLSTMVRNPELQFMHNSMLQQLFDGGIIGAVLLSVTLYWTAVRLAGRRQSWGNIGSAAILATTALILSGMTEVSLAPGPAYDSFYILMVLVGVACQGGRMDHNAHQSSGMKRLRVATPHVRNG